MVHEFRMVRALVVLRAEGGGTDAVEGWWSWCELVRIDYERFGRWKLPRGCYRVAVESCAQRESATVAAIADATGIGV